MTTAAPLSLRPGEPWALLDDARPGGEARLFVRPREVVTTDRPAEVDGLLSGLEERAEAGRVAVGWLAYEAGAAFEAKAPIRPGVDPLLWFGVFDGSERVVDVADRLPPPAGGVVVDQQPGWSGQRYQAAFDAVAEAIRAGTVYQANLTFPSRLTIAGDPLAVYARLREAAAAPYCAIVWTGERLVLSFSPELFLELADGVLTARPMKGTAARAPGDPEADRALAAGLSADEKSRAENRMIVDLIRNDLSRVAVPGTVRVRDAFAVERYPTVHQMTTTVTAHSALGAGPAAAIRALFPCGSITGAPKLAALQVLHEVEDGARGVYCGAIGRIGPGRTARLSVAIRTLAVAPQPAARRAGGLVDATLGLGSGVVADSTAAAEYAECLLKGQFAATAVPAFDLIETLRYTPEGGCERLERHLARLADSAATLGFAYDRHLVRNELQAATFGRGRPARVRVLLSRRGSVAVDLAPVPAEPDRPWRVALAPIDVPHADLRRWHKTTDRAFYDGPRHRCGADEVVFVEGGQITEGSFTSVFVERAGRLVTPPARAGLLPGVLRQDLIDAGRAVEADLTPADLTGGFWLGNSLRGLIEARLTPVS